MLDKDHSGRIWVGGPDGLAVIHEDGSVQSYDQEDGLVWNDIAQAGFSAGPDGTVLIGTGRGLAYFRSSGQRESNLPPRTALTSVFLGGSQLPAILRRFLHNIHGSGEHLLGIINDILDLSKIEAGHMQLELAEVHIRPVVDGVVTIMKGITGKRDIKLEVDVELIDNISRICCSTLDRAWLRWAHEAMAFFSGFNASAPGNVKVGV